MEIRKEAENYNAGGQLGSEDVDSQDLADDMHKDRNRSRTADSDHSQERERERERKVISGGKGFKKPDKILPCPRCNSMETKFCYFNNYNVNQPRHFCRNCQRYWTAGGTIRNVPVGAGRRKNKHLSSPAAGSSGGGDSPKPAGFSRDTREAHHQGGSDADALLLYNSVAATTTTTTLLTLQEDQNKLVKSSPPPTPCQNIVSPQQEVAQTNQFSSCGSHVGLVPPPPAAYTWNIGWNGMAAYGTDNGGALLVPWAFSPMGTYPPHGPGACHGPGVSGGISVPFPFVPPAASYVGWNASCWNLATSSQLSPSSSASNSNGSCCSGNSGSPSLGKHSRDLNAAQGEEEPVEKCLWVPKTLRMDDPDEAAKSSIWTTLGIKPDRIQPLSREVRVEKFDNASSRAPTKEADDGALQANPAALSRSQAFQEST